MVPGSDLSAAFALNDHATALCLVPPEHCRPPVDRLRALYDRTYRKWPPHVNLVYPFVQPERLDAVCRVLQSALRRVSDAVPSAVDVSLDTVGVFHQRHEKTLFLHDARDEGSAEPLRRLRDHLLAALGHDDDRTFQMHMTVAQSSGSTTAGQWANTDEYHEQDTVLDTRGHAHQFLRHKVGLLPPVAWRVDGVHILVRERLPMAGRDGEIAVSSRMRLWGVLHFDGTLETLDRPTLFYDEQSWHEHVPRASDVGRSEKEEEEEEEDDKDDDVANTDVETFNALTFVPEDDAWMRCDDDLSLHDGLPSSRSDTAFVVATYNVLGEFAWPPSLARVPRLMHAVLEAAADVLVLQEVTDDVLSALLADHSVRAAYPFVSHGPPAQADLEPLPNLLNLVALSRRPFVWSWLSLHQAHKGALLVRFPESELVLATVHLTHGLTNGAVAAKRKELHCLLSYLRRVYRPEAVASPTVVVAGDFNIHTSASSIEAAVQRQALTAPAARYVASGFDSLFSRHGLVDAWTTMHDDEDDDDGKHSDIGPGEAGATYNPLTNALASRIVGMGPNDRPQRFDRIMVRRPADGDGDGPSCSWRIAHVSQFGRPVSGEDSFSLDTVASDHWGVCCVFDTTAGTTIDTKLDIAKATSPELDPLVVPVVPARAPEGVLAEPRAVEAALDVLGVVPSAEDAKRRRAALDLLKQVLQVNTEREPAAAAAAQTPQTPRQLVLVPVGSYALDVWTPASDLDCLCIGVFSAATFFALATQRLRAAERAGTAVRIVRRVRAQTGTMLELELGDDRVRADLQYCQAAAVVETWPAVLVVPATHRLLTLPRSTLAKLKAARDTYALRQSFPVGATHDDSDVWKSMCNAHVFCVAHRAIRTWATSRGLYAARFGYLGGVQIALLLARVLKLAAHRLQTDGQIALGVGDVLVTFFRHYATFDWTTQIAFDPFGPPTQSAAVAEHKPQLAYRRTARESCVVLGYYGPQRNTSMAASVPSVRVLTAEFVRAARLLGGGGVGLTWTSFLRGGHSDDETAWAVDDLKPGPAAFLQAYRSYVRIDVQYWGLSRARGAAFVGWVEARCVLLLVDLARRVPTLTAQIWPGRFVERGEHEDEVEDEDKESGTRQYAGCYLVGLDLPMTMDRSARQVALAPVQAVLGQFAQQLTTASAAHYDPQWQWLQVGVVNRATLPKGLRLDTRMWGEHIGEEEEEEEEEEEQEQTQTQARAATQTQARTQIPARGKFRTASDVIKRLRWDPQMDVDDYLVGYEDRFAGAQEKLLTQWATESLDVTFIPLHRILYVRRRSDGIIVWDRRARIDLLFGQ